MTKDFLNTKDKTILKVILEKPTAQINEIVEKTGILRDTVARSSKKLLNYVKILPKIDKELLGLKSESLVLIKFKIADNEQILKFITNLENNANIVSIIRTRGNFDLFVKVVYIDIVGLTEILNNIKKVQPQIIEKLETQTILTTPKEHNYSALL